MILGIVINLFFSLFVIPEFLGKKRKIGFFWSLIACLFLTPIIGVIIVLLSPKLEEFKKENVRNVKTFSKRKTNIIENKANLESLLIKGVLSPEEYKNKLERIEKENRSISFKETDEYTKLKSLLGSGIFSQEEFDSKISILEDKKKKANKFIKGYADIYILRPKKKIDKISTSFFEIYIQNQKIDKLPADYYLHLKIEIIEKSISIMSKADNCAEIIIEINPNDKYYILQDSESTPFSLKSKLELIDSNYANTLISELKLRKAMVVS